VTSDFLGHGAAFADRYRIERELGQGGMATVYLAEDLKHQRRVAIKVLRPELAAALGAERFLREITTTANLRHPHILPLYDSGDADGSLFYVMPYVEGESLRDRLDREKQLPLDDALQIAGEVADALSYAHSSGVIHRDIKPENILLDNGHAIVADFGIAQAVSESGGERLTQTGIVLGTPLYMSPEQSNGDPVDARSDLYALGCLVYEMLAGVPPFSGPTALVLMARHALDPVPALRTARPSVTASVAEAVERALAKTPADRFPTVRAWHDALMRPPAAVGATDPRASGDTRAAEGFWVAVLPFKCSSSGTDLSTFAEGLSEEIVTGLSRFSYLRVIARSSTSRYAGEAVDIRSVGRELGARYVMEGSLRQAGPRIRIAVQLVDASSGAHLWAESYDRAFSPEAVFELQDDLVPRIVSTVADMHGVLPHTMSETLRNRDPAALSPYEMVLRGFGYIERITADEHTVVRAGLERAVQQAPDHADCWAMLSNLYAEEHKHGFNVRPDPLGRALEAARRAVAAAPSDHLAYHVLAQAHFFRREFQAFRTAADRAIALNPMDGCTTAFMGILMAYAGDWDRGCALAERAMLLNPHHPGWYRFSAFFNAYRQGDFQAALDIALRMNMPSYFYTHIALAAAYAQLGEQAAASHACRELLEQKPDFAQVAREELGKWMDSGLVDQVIDGLRKAGLEIAGTPDDAGLAGG
jgi:serine/threonine protein kinase